MKRMLAQMGEHRSKQSAAAGSSPAHSSFFSQKLQSILCGTNNFRKEITKMREIKIIGMDELEIIEVYGKWRLEHLRETKIYFVCYNGKVEVEGTYKECKKFFNKYNALYIIWTKKRYFELL